MAYQTKKWGRVLLRRRNRTKLVVVGLAFSGLIVGATGILHQERQVRIDPAAYTPLLNTIAKGESSDNYNAYFGSPGNTTVRFTDMSIAEVMRWQEEYVRQGSISSAIGRYQIVRPTLAGLVNRQRIDPNARFDEAMQDRLAISLLERRGAVEYVTKEISREQFAANLAKEWAALPRIAGDKPSESYYAGDGINQSRVSIDEIYQAIANLEV